VLYKKDESVLPNYQCIWFGIMMIIKRHITLQTFINDIKTVITCMVLLYLFLVRGEVSMHHRVYE